MRRLDIPRARRYPRRPIRRPIAEFWTMTFPTPGTWSTTAWIEAKIPPPSNEQFMLVNG